MTLGTSQEKSQLFFIHPQKTYPDGNY